MKRRLYHLFLSLLSGFILWISWPSNPLGFLAFLGFVPLFELERSIFSGQGKRKTLSYFGYVYLAMLVWNVLTTWWVWYATPGGMIGAELLNSLLMTIPFVLYSVSRRNIGLRLGSLAFITYWLAFEYMHFVWDLSWPWLTLGNVFATLPDMVQWYEYTGVLGGTLWILILNFKFYTLWRVRRQKLQYISTGLWILIPVLGSQVVGINPKSMVTMLPQGAEVVVLQPNLDPYTEKFSGDLQQQLEDFIEESEKKITPETDYLVWPETAIQGFYNLNKLDNYDLIRQLKNYYRLKHPDLTVVSGIDLWRNMEAAEQGLPTANYHKAVGYYESFNSAIQFGAGEDTIYHKTKLVVGVEKIPYPWLFKPIIESFEIMGAANCGTNPTPALFNNGDWKVIPTICYESVYGAYLGEFVQKGGNMIFIMTNDGWWSDTEGHRQHIHYARLRAIELRKPIARSANTGVSCFIDEYGHVSQATAYDEKAVIKGNIVPNSTVTFYASHGDYIGRTAAFLAVIMVLYSFVARRIKK